MATTEYTVFLDQRSVDERMGPYLVDTQAAAGILDEAIGALALAYEAVESESGRNPVLAHAWCAMKLAIRSLDQLRDTVGEAELARAPAAVLPS